MVKYFRPPNYISHAERPSPSVVPFPFLSLPRELRDKIYTYTFPHRPITYNHLPRSEPTAPPSYLPLLLTCRQIHSEASQTLFLTHSIHLDTRFLDRGQKTWQGHVLLDMLRFFPSAQARLVTRIETIYSDVDFMSEGVDELGEMWKKTVKEAWVLKEVFPRLTVLRAEWQWYVTDLGDNGGDVEELAEQWVKRMQVWSEGKTVVPPVWLRVELPSSHEDEEMMRQEEGLALASRSVAKEGVMGKDMDEWGECGWRS